MNRNLRKDSDAPVKRKAKRTLGLLLALALCLAPAIAFAPVSKAANVILIGDVDGSGAVNKDDVTLLSQYLAGWEGSADKVDMDAADLDRDGKVTKADAAILARYAAAWDGYDMYAGTLYVKNPLAIVKEPVDVEMIEKSAVLSITVSGEFDSIVYDWQKKTASGWRDAPTLNSDDATYTVNNAALQIVSKNGVEGYGEYRCIVSAFYKGSLVAQVTSRTATVDPQPEPMEATLARPEDPTKYFYFYHCQVHKTEDPDPLHPGKNIFEQPIGPVLKNYSQPRFEEATAEIIVEPFWECGYDNGEWPLAFIYKGAHYDSDICRKNENGEYYTTEILLGGHYQGTYQRCSISSVSGGKGPYTYTWYISKDRFGNDFQPLIEGYNCFGQGTEEIIVWPSDTSNQEMRFMGFLCCRVTDAKGRTTNACYFTGHNYTNTFRYYLMLYALGEKSLWFEYANHTTEEGIDMWWWTYPDNEGIGRWY